MSSPYAKHPDLLKTKDYSPAGGSDGVFYVADTICTECEHEREYRETYDASSGCPILTYFGAYGKTTPEYPNTIISNHDGKKPRCLKFKAEKEEGEPYEEKPYVDNKTLDLFKRGSIDGNNSKRSR